MFEEEIDRKKQQRMINIENVEMKKEHLAALVAIFISGRATNSSKVVKLITTDVITIDAA
jgi:hypothetical protein